MSRRTLLPTPASSIDLRAQDGAELLAASLLPAFSLPPPAKTDGGMPSPPLDALALSPRLPTAEASDTFSLPPPPTRPRTILQVWPAAVDKGRKAPKTAKTTKTARTAQQQQSSATSSARANKKGGSSTATTGRKSARRTAHSLIERRRRSKMNDAFAELQGLVPACTGEMHKLAILQASIEYVRYLEGCVATLQAHRASEQQQHHRQQQQQLKNMDDNMSGDSDDEDDGDPMEQEALETETEATVAATETATAALLMLNRDRRGSGEEDVRTTTNSGSSSSSHSGPVRGLSVRDLLST